MNDIKGITRGTTPAGEPYMEIVCEGGSVMLVGAEGVEMGELYCRSKAEQKRLSETLDSKSTAIPMWRKSQ